jgi:hypothetical protein
MRTLRLLAAAAVAAVLAAPAAAGPTPLQVIATVDNQAANPGNVARVRVVHASPDAPSVDVRVNGGLAFGGVAFGEATVYASLPAGTYTVQVEPAGAGNTGPFVIDADLTLLAGQDYTVVATNFLASITPIILVDDNSAPAAGNARVRVFHGSPDTPAVDIAVTGGPVLFANAPFQASATGEVPGGTYDLEARVAGTQIVGLYIPGVTFEAGKVYTVFAIGELADGAADRTLYLNDGRFRVEANWADFVGNSGIARATSESDLSGGFWFFHPQVSELVVKVLDGRTTNGNFWVFYGSLSNVEFTIRVEDTETGEVREYFNPSGTFASVGDPDAFPAN